MKAILEFILPEDIEDHELACHARDWYCVVVAMREWLESNLDSESRYGTADQALEEARSYLMQELEERGIDLEL